MFNYADIKFNVLIQTNKTREATQTMNREKYVVMKTCLIYVGCEKIRSFCVLFNFVRKEDLFESVHQACHLKDKELIVKHIKQMIISQNMSALSLYFQTIDKDELEHIKSNKNEFDRLFQRIAWKKGATLF